VVLAVALVLLGLSLSYLAAGIALVTGAGLSDGPPGNPPAAILGLAIPALIYALTRVAAET
jgi:hypothetical protein